MLTNTQLLCEVDGDLQPTHWVKRVLDVDAGQLCFIIGTIYLEMALKPDVLAEISRRVRPRQAPADAEAHFTSLTFHHQRAHRTTSSCSRSRAGQRK